MGLYRKGDTWFIDYYCEGRRVREKVGSNKVRAQQALAKRRTDILDGKFFCKRSDPAISFRDFAAYYWDLHGKYKRTKSYRLMLDQLLPVFGDLSLDKITVPMVLEYRNKVRERANSSTANRHHSFLRSMFNKAAEWGKFGGENPAAKIKQEREKNHRLRYLSESEMARLLQACHGRIYPVVVCALLTGMRKGEILGLRWENIDLEHGIIYVLQSKSGKPREIPVSAKLRQVLTDIGPAKKGLVFEVPEITLRRAFQKVLEIAKIDAFRFHDLRHTFASHYIMKTSGLPALQRLLGHQSPMMTQRYAHLATSHLRSGIDKLDSGMDTFWTPNPFSTMVCENRGTEKTFVVPVELLCNGDVAQGLERAFHKR